MRMWYSSTNDVREKRTPEQLELFETDPIQFQKDVEEMNRTPRSTVYAAIDEEIEFRKDRVCRNTSDPTVAEDMVIIAKMLNSAIEHWVEYRNDRHALGEIRKILAVGVRCMETNGVPTRANEEEEKRSQNANANSQRIVFDNNNGHQRGYCPDCKGD
jgi:hypothetical protein